MYGNPLWKPMRVIVRQGKRLDRNLIVDELQTLVALKAEPEILDKLANLFKKYP